VTSSRSPIHPSLAIGLLAVLGILVWLNSGGSGDDTDVPVRMSLQVTVYVTVLAIEAELDATGTLPPDLESMGMDAEGLTYMVDSDQQYTLVAQEEDVSVQYRRGDDLEPFRQAFEELLPPFRAGR